MAEASLHGRTCGVSPKVVSRTRLHLHLHLHLHLQKNINQKKAATRAAFD